MTRFPQVDHPDDPELKALYEEVLAVGWHGADPAVPMNGITALAARPDILGAMWALTKGVVLQGQLPPTLKEMVAMAIAVHNGCRYCTVGHTRALEGMGVPTAVIQSCAADPEMAQLPPAQRAIIRFALKAARSPHGVGPADIEELRGQGLSDGDIIEVIMLAAWAGMLNTWTDVSGVAVDARGRGQESA